MTQQLLSTRWTLLRPSHPIFSLSLRVSLTLRQPAVTCFRFVVYPLMITRIERRENHCLVFTCFLLSKGETREPLRCCRSSFWKITRIPFHTDTILFNHCSMRALILFRTFRSSILLALVLDSFSRT